MPHENNVGKGENADSQLSSFLHNVFYSIKDEFNVLSYIWFVACKCFQFGQR